MPAIQMHVKKLVARQHEPTGKVRWLAANFIELHCIAQSVQCDTWMEFTTLTNNTGVCSHSRNTVGLTTPVHTDTIHVGLQHHRQPTQQPPSLLAR